MTHLTIGSLFSGIGGLDLGIERGLSAAGVPTRTLWQVERNDFCRKILARHWPHAERYTDVRDITASSVDPIDILCGGFPCQDLSVAGKQAGLEGDRSGLFYEMARIVREIRPRIWIMENVPNIVNLGLSTVLSEVAACGYDARWGMLRADDPLVGAPHRRERCFCVAWLADNDRERGTARARLPAIERADLSDPDRGDGRSSSMADSIGSDIRSVPGGIRRPPGAPQGEGDQWERGGEAAGSRGEAQLADSIGYRPQGEQPARTATRPAHRTAGARERGPTQSEVGRGIAGIPARLDIPHRWPAPPGPQHDWEPPRTRPRQPHDRERLKALGNSVVPACAEIIGRFVASELLEVE